MSFAIPNAEGQIRQSNRGDIFGELWGTFNIDLTTSPGKIKVSKRLSQVLTDTNLDDEDVVAITVHDGFYYVLTTDTLFKCSVSSDPRTPANWSEDATVAGTAGLALGFESDIVSFDGALLLSGDDDIHKFTPSGPSFDADWWTGTISGAALTADKPHIMHVKRGGQETLFVTDSNKVKYYNATAGHSVVTLDSFLTACCIDSGVGTTWVGTYTEIGDKAYVYEIYVGEQIDGAPVSREAYPVDGRAVLSIAVVDGIPRIVTEKGVIQEFNGAGFVTVGHFPFAYESNEIDGVRSGLVQDVSISRPVHPKGMKARNRSLLIALNSRNADTTADPVNERTPSGVWEFNLDTRVLNHRQSLSTSSHQYGSQKQQRSGPLEVVDNIYTTLMVAGETESGEAGLFMDSELVNQGYIITPEQTASGILDSFAKAVIKARTLQVGESIVLKYRTEKDPNYPQYNDIIWLNATQFNCTESTMENAEVGDQIEITEGYRAGHLAHITEITGTVTRTVTIDESIGSLNEESRIRLQNWTKSGAEYTDEHGEVREFGTGQTKPWIQHLVQMTGDVELRQFLAPTAVKSTV